MEPHKQKLFLNIATLLLVSLLCIGIIAISYHYYRQQQTKNSQPIYITNDPEYSYETVSRQGIRIANNGSLQLMLDPYTNYILRSNQKTNKVTIDSHGFRGSFDDKDPRPRIAITGGSVAFGEGLNNDNETLAAVLERKNPKYQVINAGVTGFVSGQELAYQVNYLSDYHPKIVMSFSGWNDLTDICAKRYAKFEIRTYTYGVNEFFDHLENQLIVLQNIQGINNYTIGAGQYRNPEASLSDDEVIEKAYVTYVNNAVKMDAFAKGNGATFILVIQPEITTKKIKTEEEKIHFETAKKNCDFQKRYKKTNPIHYRKTR